MADPPYGREEAKRYGVPMPNMRKVFTEIRRVLKVGGHLVYLDTRHPMYRKDYLHLWGILAIVRSSNHAYRAATCFTRVL